MLIEVICIQEGENKVCGTYRIPMNEYLNINEEWVLFRAFQYKNEKENPLGMIEGQLRIRNLPNLCQMKFGIHLNGEILDSALLCDHFYNFSDEKKKVVRLQESLNRSYNPSSLPSSPFEIPLSPIFEIEIRQHLEQLKEPLGTWETSLLYLGNSLKDDRMSKETFLQAFGINIITSFLSSHYIEILPNSETDAHDQNLSICLSSGLNTILLAMDDCKFCFFLSKNTFFLVIF